jgi:hypothetical protein
MVARGWGSGRGAVAGSLADGYLDLEGSEMTLDILFILLLLGGICSVCFVAGRRFERDKWALCSDCGDLRSSADIVERDGLCHDCRRKLWGEMA